MSKYWQPDEEAEDCLACGIDFGLLKRKHHCRRCGHIFCDECCPVRELLSSGAEYGGQRCCSECWGAVTNAQFGSGHPRMTTRSTSAFGGTDSNLPIKSSALLRAVENKDDQMSTTAGDPLSRHFSFPSPGNVNVSTPTRLARKQIARTDMSLRGFGGSRQGSVTQVRPSGQDLRSFGGGVSRLQFTVPEGDIVDAEEKMGDDDMEEGEGNGEDSTNDEGGSGDGSVAPSSIFVLGSHATPTGQRRSLGRATLGAGYVQGRPSRGALLRMGRGMAVEPSLPVDALTCTLAELSRLLRMSSIQRVVSARYASATQARLTAVTDRVRRVQMAAAEEELERVLHGMSAEGGDGHLAKTAGSSSTGMVHAAAGESHPIVVGRAAPAHVCCHSFEVQFGRGPTGIAFSQSASWSPALALAIGMQPVQTGPCPSSSFSANEPSSPVPGRDRGQSVTMPSVAALRSRYGVGRGITSSSGGNNGGISGASGGSGVRRSSGATSGGMLSGDAAGTEPMGRLFRYTSAQEAWPSGIPTLTELEEGSIDVSASPAHDAAQWCSYSLSVSSVTALGDGSLSPAQEWNERQQAVQCCAWIRPGLLLSHVNGVSTAGLDCSRALDALASAPRPVQLRFVAPAVATLRTQTARLAVRLQEADAAVASLSAALHSALQDACSGRGPQAKLLASQLTTLSVAYVQLRERATRLENDARNASIAGGMPLPAHSDQDDAARKVYAEIRTGRSSSSSSSSSPQKLQLVMEQGNSSGRLDADQEEGKCLSAAADVESPAAHPEVPNLHSTSLGDGQRSAPDLSVTPTLKGGKSRVLAAAVSRMLAGPKPPKPVSGPWPEPPQVQAQPAAGILGVSVEELSARLAALATSSAGPLRDAVRALIPHHAGTMDGARSLGGLGLDGPGGSQDLDIDLHANLSPGRNGARTFASAASRRRLKWSELSPSDPHPSPTYTSAMESPAPFLGLPPALPSLPLPRPSAYTLAAALLQRDAAVGEVARLQARVADLEEQGRGQGQGRTLTSADSGGTAPGVKDGQHAEEDDTRLGPASLPSILWTSLRAARVRTCLLQEALARTASTADSSGRRAAALQDELACVKDALDAIRGREHARLTGAHAQGHGQRVGAVHGEGSEASWASDEGDREDGQGVSFRGLRSGGGDGTRVGGGGKKKRSLLARLRGGARGRAAPDSEQAKTASAPPARLAAIMRQAMAARKAKGVAGGGARVSAESTAASAPVPVQTLGPGPASPARPASSAGVGGVSPSSSSSLSEGSGASTATLTQAQGQGQGNPFAGARGVLATDPSASSGGGAGAGNPFPLQTTAPALLSREASVEGREALPPPTPTPTSSAMAATSIATAPPGQAGELFNDVNHPFGYTASDEANARLALSLDYATLERISGVPPSQPPGLGATYGAEGGVLTGHLYKRSRDAGRKAGAYGPWAWRFATAGGGQCAYYRSEYDTEPAGTFRLAAVLCARPCSQSSAGKPHALEIVVAAPGAGKRDRPAGQAIDANDVTVTKSYVFALTSRAERDAWGGLLKACAAANCAGLRQAAMQVGPPSAKSADTTRGFAAWLSR